ncbi:MAG: D-alanyl-D-alanine carboxypeptidase, partial [Flavihumibacter sp.]
MQVPKYSYWSLLAGICLLAACSPWSKLAKTTLAGKEGLQTAHLGVLVVDADKNKTLCDYQSAKLFIPASNTKLLSMYAALKLLGDS